MRLAPHRMARSHSSLAMTLVASLAAFLHLAFSCPTASADPPPLEQPTRREPLDPKGEAARLDDASLRLDDFRFVEMRLPEARSDDLLGQVCLARRIPGSQVIRYRGFQGFVVSRLRRAYQARWRRSLRDAERAGGLDHFELAEHYQAMGDAESDLARGGRWWERSWLDSLTPERGGAPELEEVEVGERIEVIRWGPLRVTNDCRAKLALSGFGIGVDSDGPLFRDLAEATPMRDYARLTRDRGDHAEREDLDDLPDAPRRPRAETREHQQSFGPDERLTVGELLDLSIEAIVPPSETFWNFSVRPEVRVRVRPGSPPGGRVGLRGVLELYHGPPAARKHVVDVVGRVRYDLRSRELVATLQLQIVSW